MIAAVPQVPEKMREAARRGTLIPFIGAGVSRLAGCPSWADLADSALRHFVAQGRIDWSEFEQIRHLNPRVKLSLVRSLEREHNLRIDFPALLKPQPSGLVKGARLYRSLFKLGKTFVTTNYDEWLDSRIQDPDLAVNPSPAPIDPVLEPMQVVYRKDELLPTLLGQPNTTIHLHGSLRDPSGMVVTTQDYIQHYANDRFTSRGKPENPVLTFLDYMFEQKTVVFIGYGREELEVLEYVVQKARRTGAAVDEARHYILQGFFSHETVLFRSLRSYYLHQCGIQLIPYLRDKKDWDQLLDVLDEFGRIVPASDILVLEKIHEMRSLLDE